MRIAANVAKAARADFAKQVMISKYVSFSQRFSFVTAVLCSELRGEFMASKADDVRPSVGLAAGLGNVELVFNDDEVVELLKIAIEHEGSQMAFAKHHGINRTYLNMVLSGKKHVGDVIGWALGLRRVYARRSD